MRFMVLVPGSPESEAGEMPSTEILGAMTKYNEELVKSGVMPRSPSARWRPPLGCPGRTSAASSAVRSASHRRRT